MEQPTKQELRVKLAERHEEITALRLAATAIMNGSVVWSENGSIGYSEYYEVEITRTRGLSGAGDAWWILSARYRAACCEPGSMRDLMG